VQQLNHVWYATRKPVNCAVGASQPIFAQKNASKMFGVTTSTYAVP
jgi:hypothetical protein